MKKKYKYLLLLIVVGIGIVFAVPYFTKQSTMKDFLQFYYYMDLDQANEVLEQANNLDSEPFYEKKIKEYATEKGERLYISGAIAHRMIDYMNWGIEKIELSSVSMEAREDKYYYSGEVKVVHGNSTEVYPISGFLEIKQSGLSWKIDSFKEENYLYNQLMNKYEQ